MRKFLAHTDLTNPERYNAMMNQNIISVEREYDRQYCGTIKRIDLFTVEFEESGKYYVEDMYGNHLYISFWKYRSKVMDLINSVDFQLAESFEEFDIIIRKYFNRKPR